MEGDGATDIVTTKNVELINCSVCGRHFSSDVLVKHEPICMKNSKKKRKIFNSGIQRAEGSDIPINKILKPGEVPKPDPKLALAEARTKLWRDKHNLLVESFRAARDYAKAKSIGAPLPPPPPAVVDPSLIQCPYCQRRFNEESSKRHIPFCKEHQAKVVAKTAATPTSSVTTKKTLPKIPPGKVKLSSPSQRIPVSSSNGTRMKTSPQPPVTPTNNRPEVRTTRTSNVSGKIAMTRATAVATPTTVTSTRPSSGTRHTVATTKVSGLPRGNVATPHSRTGVLAPRLAQVPAPRVSTPAHAVNTNGSGGGGYCHECGQSYPVATARFCSDCGVRRLCM